MENQKTVNQILKENQEKLESKIVSLRVLRTFRDTYYTTNPESKNLDYEPLSQLLNSAFDIYCTGRDLWLLDEPTVEDDILDLQQQFRNLNL